MKSELGKAAGGVDGRYAESELARLAADEAVLGGAVAQAQADLAEAGGKEKFIPTVGEVNVPSWDAPIRCHLASASRPSAPSGCTSPSR